MASLVPGYNYDIFISYRQKDNKGDRWVSEFVDALKDELESTFKEEVSVYFDINPHDGLLELHDVNESLKDKLNCLVFLPIVSRTYCDPKSFAWDHEFKAFVERASGDQFGLKIRLPDGNVASRVLPVRIYELDDKDIKLCESVLQSVLRGVEFIYKEPGVNRPLTGKDDERKNLSGTIYRNQINKVANALETIMNGLMQISIAQTEKKEKVDDQSEKISPPFTDTGTKTIFKDREKEQERQYSDKVSHTKRKKSLYTLSSLTLILAFIALFLFSSSSTLSFTRHDWILITDFENQSDDPLFDKSLNTALGLTISQSRYVNIFPRSRMFETLVLMNKKDQTFIDDKTGRDIAIREGINIYIVPSIGKVGNRYMIAAKLIQADEDNILSSEVLYADSRDEILKMLDQLSRKIRRILGESRYNILIQDKPLAKVTTSSIEALKQFSLGVERHWKSDFSGAKGYYENALAIDTGFTSAKASLGNLLFEKFDAERGRELLKQAIKNVDNLTDREKYGIRAFYEVEVKNNLTGGIDNTRILIRLYPDDPTYHNNLGYYYQLDKQYEDALTEYKKAVKINPDLVLTYSGILWIYDEYFGIPDSSIVWSEKLISDNPQSAWGYFHLASAWFCLDSLSKAEQDYLKARELDPNLTLNLYRLAHLYRIEGRNEEAIKVLERIIEIADYEYAAYLDIGRIYSAMGDKEEAIKYFTRFKKLASTVWIKQWPDYYGTYTSLSAAYALLNDQDSSRVMLQKAVSLDSTKHFEFATIYCLQDNIPEALNQIETALNDGYRNLTWLKMHPDLQRLRYDIRFHGLLDKYFKPLSSRLED
jgi:tetratricopeptide (TPR) repeat protein